MSGYVNLHSLPADQRMYTLAVTRDPVDQPRDDRWFDEVDFVAPAGLDHDEVIAAARKAGALEAYGPEYRVVGAINQSEGLNMAEDWEGLER